MVNNKYNGLGLFILFLSMICFFSIWDDDIDRVLRVDSVDLDKVVNMEFDVFFSKDEDKEEGDSLDDIVNETIDNVEDNDDISDEVVNNNEYNVNNNDGENSEVVNSKERNFVHNNINFVSLNNVSYVDDHYLFAGDVYYLNPYDLSMKCDSSNYLVNAKNNDNSCMKWYELSEDDEYVTLILNSNLGGALESTEDILGSANKYLKSFTDLWDDRLLVFDNVIIDGYDYTGCKARMVSMDEISYVVEHENWSKNDYLVSNDIMKRYSSFLYDNLNLDSWNEAGYFTSTGYSNDSNYVFNKNGFDISVADGYTHGVRPVITLSKKYLNLNRKIKQEDVTYLNSSIITKGKFSDNGFEYHIKNMRAAGIKKVYLNFGRLELVSKNKEIIFKDTISNFINNYESEIASSIRIGKKYGVEVIPWLNFPMELDYINADYSDSVTGGDYVIKQFKKIIERILAKGFYSQSDGKCYYVTEIHLDAEPMKESYQKYYLKLIKSFDAVIGNKANFTIASPSGEFFSDSYIKKLACYVNGFNIMMYDSNGSSSLGNVTQSRSEYLEYVKKTIKKYSSALGLYQTEFYAMGAMYDDRYISSNEGWPNVGSNKVYTHLNFYNGEEIETLGNLVEAVKSLNDSRLTGIGFYNWEGFSSYSSGYNLGSYITDSYNYRTVRNSYLKNWTYS